MFLNKGMILITCDEKSPKTYREHTNVKIYGYFNGEKLMLMRIYLSFDYDIYTLLKCEIDEDRFNELKEKIGWSIPFEESPKEFAEFFSPETDQNSSIDILYTITPFFGKMTFHEITSSQRIFLFDLTFNDCDRAESFDNAQTRYDDVRNDLHNIEKQKEIIYKYLHDKNPKLLDCMKQNVFSKIDI